jgi:hypothetical protein
MVRLICMAVHAHEAILFVDFAHEVLLSFCMCLQERGDDCPSGISGCGATSCQYLDELESLT